MNTIYFWFIISMLAFTHLVSPVPIAIQSVKEYLKEGVSIDHQPGVVLLEGSSTDWWSSVQANLEHLEYKVDWYEVSYQAANLAHNLRSFFFPRGLTIVPRNQGETALEGSEPEYVQKINEDWQFNHSLKGWGRAGHLLPLSEIEPAYQENRVTSVYTDELEGWYVNSPRGYEQGLTILTSQPSPVVSKDLPIVLEMAIQGNLTPTLVNDGQAEEWATAGGNHVLTCADLHAWDANSKILPTSNTISPGYSNWHLTLAIEDNLAVYPLMVDPLFTLPNWTAESNQEEAQFGYSVSDAGDVNGDGYSDVIVGATFYSNGEYHEGSSYVYHGSINGLETSPSWTAESDQIMAWFGFSTSGAGDVNGDGYDDVIVGARYFDNGQVDEGRVFVYYGSNAGLATSPSWTAESNQANAEFGYSVSSAGDVNGDGYDDVIVGAPFYDNGQVDEGRAYVYYGSNAGLATSPSWTMESDQAYGLFGYPISEAGDVNGDGYSDVIIGATGFENGQNNKGRMFVFHGSANGLMASPSWTAESSQENSAFGYSASFAGDVNGDGYSDVIISAPWYDNGEEDEGRVYVYHGSANGLSVLPSWTVESDQIDAYFGWSASNAGDVDDDGYSDVIVGAIFYDNGQVDEGRAYVYHGSEFGLDASPAWTMESDQEMARFGWSSSSAGDVNGDGYSDVIVSANLFDNGQINEGRAYVYHGWALPYSFSRVSPDNGAENVYTNPTLSWTDSRGVDNYEYCYDISDDDECSAWINNSTSSFVNLSGLDLNTTYYWHVRASNSFGTTYADGSEVHYWSFTTANIRGGFNKENPPDNATGQPTNLTLEWGDSDGVMEYEYCYDISNDDACSEWISSGTTSGAILSGLDLNKTYYWQVRATSNSGIIYADGSEKEYWSFKVVNKIFLAFVSR